MAPTLRTRAPKAPAAASTTPATTKKKKVTVTQAAKKASTKAKAAPKADKAVPAPAAKATSVNAKSTATPKGAAAKKDSTSKTSASRTDKAAANSKSNKKPTSGTTTASKGKPGSRKPAAKKSSSKAKDVDTDLPILDHSAYPHIFDAIVEAARYESLLALRATCKDMRTRADALLGYHVVLRAGLPPPKGAKWERSGLPRGPAKARARTYRVNAGSLDGQLPGWVCDYNHVNNNYVDSCGEDCDRYRAYWENVFANDTKIVDWQPWGDQGYMMERAAKAFCNLEVIRCFPFETQRCMFKAPKVVIFCDFENPEPKAYNAVGYTPTAYLDEPTAKHLVTTVEYDTARPTLPNCWVTLPSLGSRFLEDATLIFFPAEDSGDCVNPEWNSPEPRPSGVLWEVQNWLRVGSKIQFTLVGATEMPPHLIGVPDGIERTREELQEKVLANMIEWIRNDPQEVSEEREEVIRSQITWYTREEYRNLVGPQQWRVETERSYNWNK